jgi:hypothetical protein
MLVPGCTDTWEPYVDHKGHADSLLDSGKTAARTIAGIVNANYSLPSDDDELLNVMGGKESLEATAGEVAAGNLQPVETMLFSQAATLSHLFHYLTRLATQSGQNSEKSLASYLRLAMRAQAQSVATLREFVRLKGPARAGRSSAGVPAGSPAPPPDSPVPTSSCPNPAPCGTVPEPPAPDSVPAPARPQLPARPAAPPNSRNSLQDSPPDPRTPLPDDLQRLHRPPAHPAQSPLPVEELG